MPPVVYVPVTELPEEPGVQRIKMHTMADGRTAVFVYSALDRLAESYDSGVPWVVADVRGLQKAFEEHPYDLLFIDQELRPAGSGAS